MTNSEKEKIGKRITSIEEVIRSSESTYDERFELIKKFKFEQREQSLEKKEFEDIKWSELKKIVSGERYFRLDHIDKLGLPYDILICLSSKNSGKTWEQYRMFKRFIDNQEKFIFMRALKTELDQSAMHFDQDKECPIVMTKYKDRYHIYSKKAYQSLCEEERLEGRRPILQKSLFDKYDIPLAGYAVDFCNANAIGGGTFEGFKYVVFDECLSHNPRNIINEIHLQNFSKFLSSVIRSKKEFKVYMFGNFTPKNNLILKYYGILPSDDFRYIENNGCKVLYVNLGGLYGASYENQSSITRGSTDISNVLELSDNSGFTYHEKILDIDPTLYSDLKLSKVVAYVCPNRKEFLLEIYEFKLEFRSRYLIRIKRLEFEDSVNYDDVKIFTNDIHLSTLWKGKVNYSSIIWKQLELIFKSYAVNLLFYADASSHEDFKYVVDKYRKAR